MATLTSSPSLEETVFKAPQSPAVNLGLQGVVSTLTDALYTALHLMDHSALPGLPTAAKTFPLHLYNTFIKMAFAIFV